MNKLYKQIIADMKEYVANGGFANFNDDTYYYCAKKNLFEYDINKSEDEIITNVIERMKQIIEQAEQEDKLDYSKRFDLNIFNKVTNQIKYWETRDKRTNKINHNEYCHDSAWQKIIRYGTMRLAFLTKYHTYLNFRDVFKDNKSTTQIIVDNFEYLYEITRKFKNRYTMYSDFLGYFCQYAVFPEDFINKYAEMLNWQNISHRQTLSESLIEKYADKVNWYSISAKQTLSEAFIEKYADRVDWKAISQYQVLSESFISKHADKVNWFDIFINQALSTKFILDHTFKKPDMWTLKLNKHITKEQIEYLETIEFNMTLKMQGNAA